MPEGGRNRQLPTRGTASSGFRQHSMNTVVVFSLAFPTLRKVVFPLLESPHVVSQTFRAKADALRSLAPDGSGPCVGFRTRLQRRKTDRGGNPTKLFI
jgi:hypothetical protein